jgi:hypothetical protein
MIEVPQYRQPIPSAPAAIPLPRTWTTLCNSPNAFLTAPAFGTVSVEEYHRASPQQPRRFRQVSRSLPAGSYGEIARHIAARSPQPVPAECRRRPGHRHRRTQPQSAVQHPQPSKSVPLCRQLRREALFKRAVCAPRPAFSFFPSMIPEKTSGGPQPSCSSATATKQLQRARPALMS